MYLDSDLDSYDENDALRAPYIPKPLRSEPLVKSLWLYLNKRFTMLSYSVSRQINPYLTEWTWKIRQISANKVDFIDELVLFHLNSVSELQ